MSGRFAVTEAGMEVGDWLDLAAGVLNVVVDVIDTLLLWRQR